jgi:lipopolysaccharide biosynthesis glycosyltransferase
MNFLFKQLFLLFFIIFCINETFCSTLPLNESNNPKKDKDFCAIVTLVYQSHQTDDGFVLGAENLGHSLLLSKTVHPMIALVTEQISKHQQEKLNRAGWNIKTVKAIKNHNEEYAARLDYIFSKLQIFSLYEYKKVVYLDADTIVTGNIDKLCGCPGKYCAVVRNTFFNAGVMVVEPNEEMFYDMIKKSTDTHSYTGGDQGFLNNYFWNTERCPFYDPSGLVPSDYDPNAHCHRLPGFYNGDVGMFIARENKWQFDPEEEIETPLVIHFTFSIFKPWHWWSYPIVTESWKWWKVLVISDENAEQIGIFTSLIIALPLLMIWTLLFIYEFKPKVFFPSQSKRKFPTLYQMPQFLKTMIMHLLNINCLTVAFAYSNFSTLHPYFNPFVMYLAYCTFFEIFCIQIFNYFFREPAPEINSVVSLGMASYAKKPYPGSLMAHRLIVYISTFLLICFLMGEDGSLFLKITMLVLWGLLVPCIELTYFVVKNYQVINRIT